MSTGREVIHTILRGTINILDYMRKVGCNKLIFPQSVYDLNYKFGTPEPLSADLPRINPTKGDHSVYVICKNAALDVIKYYHNEYGINAVILRLPGVYQYHPKPYILINGVMRLKSEKIIIEKAKRGKTIEIKRQRLAARIAFPARRGRLYFLSRFAKKSQLAAANFVGIALLPWAGGI